MLQAEHSVMYLERIKCV